MHIKSSRRNFLRSSAVLGATCLLASTARPTSGGSSVIVVGAGAFGGWSALQLAQRGMHVTLLDAWGPGNSRASSGGETRTIRATYGLRTLASIKTVPRRGGFQWKSRLTSCSQKRFRHKIVKFQPISHHNGGAMAFAQGCGSEQSSVALRPMDRFTVGLIGMGVILASLGLGEAVYRFAFLDFDGATDRLPIEMLFGLAFAWMTTKLARRIYQYRMETSARITLIRDRNYKIRHAVEAIIPVPYPSSQQAIRVIREEADRIERCCGNTL